MSNKNSIISVILGVISWVMLFVTDNSTLSIVFLLTAIIGIVLGIKAVKSSPKGSGDRKLAILGLVLCIVFITFVIVVMGLLIWVIQSF